MSNREQMRTILQNQMQLWSAKPLGQLLADLKERENYQVVADTVTYQVEITLLEDTEDYVHVSLAVDDGHLPSSIFPVSDSFILKKVGGKSARDARVEGSQAQS